MFFNAAMAVDRDLGVAFARALRESGEGPYRGWEMLAATGVRGLRLLHESDLFKELWLTERHPMAAEVLRRNAGAFEGQGAHALHHDSLTAIPGSPFDYVDVDPYGTPLPYLPVAFDSLRAGGVLAVTATDMMVLAGVLPGTCEARYRARPVRGRLGPEGGLRVLVGFLAGMAVERGRTIRPLLCYVRDHHVRAYVEVGTPTPGEVSIPVGMLTEPWEGPPLPGGPFGPMWLGPLFNAELVGRLRVPTGAARPKELERILGAFRGEVRADRPFFYEPNEIAANVHLARPPALAPLLERLEAAGWASGRSHARPSAFRTTAPRTEVLLAARSVSEGQSQKARVRA